MSSLWASCGKGNRLCMNSASTTLKTATSRATTQIAFRAVWATGFFITPVRLAMASTPERASTIDTNAIQRWAAL